MKKIRKALALLLAAVMIAGLSSCGGSDDESGTKLKIVQQYGMAYAPFKIMQEKQLIEKYYDGVEIEWSVLNSGQAINEGFASGDVDVGAFSSLTPEKLPDFSLFGLNFDLSVTPTIAWNWYLLIPIITFASIFLSSRLMRKLSYQPVDPSMNNGCSNWIMDLAMPAMSTYFSFMFPSLLGVYWIFNNLLGIVQQFILRAMFPAPKFTEEDYKRAEREYKGKAGSRTIENDPRVVPGKKYRSLHHIDDDDAELPVLPLDSRESDSGKAAFADEAPKLKEDKPPRKGKAEETGDDGEKAFEKEEIPDTDGEKAPEKEEIPDTDGEKTEKKDN